MVDKYRAPFGTYTGAQIAVQVAQTEIINNIISLAALYGITLVAAGTFTTDGTASVPDFNKISEQERRQLARELGALCVVIDAMPIA